MSGLDKETMKIVDDFDKKIKKIEHLRDTDWEEFNRIFQIEYHRYHNLIIDDMNRNREGTNFKQGKDAETITWGFNSLKNNKTSLVNEDVNLSASKGLCL